MNLTVQRADFSDPQLAVFLQEHLDDLAPTAPAESQHALGLDELQGPAMRLWTVQEAGSIIATGALKELDPGHSELKCMRTHPGRRGRGIGRQILAHLFADAARRGVERVSLETGTAGFFAPARTLYAGAGFTACGPFGDYRDDPNTVYMTRILDQEKLLTVQGVPDL